MSARTGWTKQVVCVVGVLLGLTLASGAGAVTVTGSPSSCVDDGSAGSIAWSNPANAQSTTGGVYATAGLNDNEVSHYLKCTGYGFSIPGGATINGITVSVRRSVDAGTTAQDKSVRLLKAGALVGSDLATNTAYPTADATATYGGSANLWGSAWTSVDINNANFGVDFEAQKAGTNGGVRTVSVDWITVAVDYTVPTVTSIALTGTSPTSSASVSWTVTFSTSVTGVDSGDFALAPTGAVTGAAISSVTGSGTTRTVTATTGSGTGTLGLNLVDNDTIVAGAVPLGGTGVGNGSLVGAVYTIDKTVPVVSSIVLASTNPTSGAGSVSWTVTFSRSVTGVASGDFSLVQTGGVSGAAISSVTGSGTTWTVTATTGTGTGNLGLNLVDDDSIVDAVGNKLGGSGTGNGNFTGAVYSVTAYPCNPPANIPSGVSVTCLCDNFTRPTLNPSTIFGANWIVSTSDSTGIVPSIVNNGYLRLTNNTGNNAKAATVPGIFPAAGNYISVEFKLYAYNGSGADGIAVTLSDYSTPPVPGAFGGSLGYAQKTTAISGFAGGWVGIALDEFGNYQNPTEGRVGGPGFLPETVGVRGSGSGYGATAYPWLQGNSAALSPTIDSASSTAANPGHTYQVIVDARNAGNATPQAFVAVNRDTLGTGTYSSIVSSFDAFARATALGYTQAPVPTNWQISFTGSTGGSTNIHEIGAVRICAQNVYPPGGSAASGFSAIDEYYGSPPIAVQNYLTGKIFTKLVGTPFKLDIAAINNSQILTTYVGSGSKNVGIKLVDNSDGACVLDSTKPNYCSATCKAKSAVTGGSQTLNFVSGNNGQNQTAAFTLNNAYNNLAVIMDDGTTSACSTDAFAVRPTAISSVVTSGIGTSASNAALTGSPSFRAGTDSFSLTASTGVAGYTGAPKINTAAMSADGAGWVVGAFSPAAFPNASTSNGNSTGSFTYAEVGHFTFLGYSPGSDATSPRGVYDDSWTSVDQGASSDCVTGSYSNTMVNGKYGCLFGLTSNQGAFGRFRPDHFSVVTGGVTPFCSVAGMAHPFTYMGQSQLQVNYTVEARNGADAKTSNYSAAMATPYPVTAPTLVAEDQAAGNQGCDLGARLGGVPATSWSGGSFVVPITALNFSRPTTLPGVLDISTPANCAANKQQVAGPFWSLDLGVRMVDADGAGLNTVGTNAANMNASASGTCSAGACDAYKLGTTAELLGRLHLLSAYGSDLLPILVPVRAEFFAGGVWSLNTDDQCTVIPANSVALGNVVPAAGSGLAMAAPPAGVAGAPALTLAGGATMLRITPNTRGAGSVDMALNLGFGVANGVNWCGNWVGAPLGAAAANPDLSFMAGNWCGNASDRAPSARLRFGASKAPYIYLRERY